MFPALRPLRVTLALACAAGLLVGPLGGAASAAPEKSELRFSLDWLFQGSQAPLVLADEGGFFEKEGLEVTVDRGAGSANTISRVATRTYDVGFADINSIIQHNANNPDDQVKAFYIVFDRSPLAIMSLADNGIDEPADLEGKTLGAPSFDGARKMFPAFARVNGLDADSITWESMDPQLREQMLVRGEVDAISGFITSGPLSIEALGVAPEDIVILRYNDYGLDFYGSALFARADFIEEHPETVAAFARAVNAAIKAAAADPDAAIDAVQARDSLIDEALEKRRFILTMKELMLTEAVKESGLSATDPERLARNIDLVAEVFELPPVAPETIYTDAFLPPASERTAPAIAE